MPPFFRQFVRCRGMEEIIHYLSVFGQAADKEIAGATGIPLVDVQTHISRLVAQGEIMACESTRFENGKEIKEVVCRVIGFMPSIKYGRKARVQLKLS